MGILPVMVLCLSTITPRGYVCLRAPGPVPMDGRLTGPAWSAAPWSDDFVDIEGDLKPKPRFRTRVKVLWDDKNLYIGAELEEPHLRATLAEHDSVIFHDNDFEVFLDPDGDCLLYSEMEMNALNTIWDLLLAKPYRAGGPPIDGWEIKGMQTAIHLNGTLNEPADTDKGWSVVIAIPFTALSQIAGMRCPPKDGDQWRINFSRVEWQTRVVNGKYETVPGMREDDWVWSAQGVVDMHRPEKWGVLQFAGPVLVPLKPYDGLRERDILIDVWEAERAFRDKHQRWATSMTELGLSNPDVTIYTTPDLFEAAVGDYRVNQDHRLWKIGKASE